MKIYKNKKSQFMIFSVMFFTLLLIIIYSQETDNSYISKSSKNNILDNIVYETCKVGKMSNGSYIDTRLGNYSLSLKNYCLNYNYTCNLSIIKDPSAPANLSLLNYSFYNFSVNYTNDYYTNNLNFTC